MTTEIERDYLRQVNIEGFILRTWETNKHANTGQELLAYEFVSPTGEILFTGSDFGCSPMHAIDSNDALRALLSFLTLRPGDTDPEYFEAYTEAQIAFCDQHAENLSLYTLDDDPAQFTDL